MLIAATIMVVGLAIVAAISHRGGYRLGGVMVLPLLTVYTFLEPLSPPIFIGGVVGAWGALWLTREYTLSHGRRVLLIAVLAGACTTILVAYIIAAHTLVRLPFDDAKIVASIFPGVAAYNLMRLDPEDRRIDVGLSIVVYVGLMLIGTAGLLFFEAHPLPTPPVLALPTSDLVVWLGIETRGGPITQITPQWLAISLLIIDISIYELVRKRYDLPLAGIVIIPLLDIFSAHVEHVAVVFVLGATAAYFAVSSIHWLSLLYGRVLLGVSLITGTLYALAVGGLTAIQLPGLSLFFLGLFIGIAAYNLYRVSPKCRTASIRISAGLFVVFYAGLLVFIDVPETGLLYHAELAYATLGAVVIALALFEVYRLEQARPSRAEFAQASVFVKADTDGPDAATSPLVDGSHEPPSGASAPADTTADNDGDHSE
ncbi:hypothetical protein GCM10008995_27540 [Halobellus salinus]|uniref:Uncharacterized protein n=1 Tax=Halobellus salinus TaxID=931585 RepID=A0A830ES26_9EURY|nr:poly-gamma-glutamate biosynthesis protein PgsC/CapC [Halobellus salinus]GGJ16190.1 hypothetical protein GCM10008995_27540 [Halobellus salinus]SMP31403.1 Capsule biosynthesis CapC [Halobellus salinus]